MKEAVAAAIERIRSAFPASELVVQEDGEGGAYVIVHDVVLTDDRPDRTWIGFRITYQYPYADVYPHYVRPDLTKRDGSPLSGKGIHPNREFQGKAATMLSRRSNRLNPDNDNALIKLEKVLHWLEELR